MKKNHMHVRKLTALGLMFVMMGSAIAGPISSPGRVYAGEAEGPNADLKEIIIETDEAEATEMFAEQSIDIFGEEAVEAAIGKDIIPEGDDSSDETVVDKTYESSVGASAMSEEQSEEIAERFYTSSVSDDKTYSKYTTTYLYKKLSSKRKKYYNRLYSMSLKYMKGNYDVEMASSGYHILFIPFSETGLTRDEAAQTAQVFIYTNPQFFFYDSGYALSQSHIGLLVHDNFANGKRRLSARNRIMKKVNVVVKSLKKAKGAKNRAKAINNWLCDNLTYASNTYDQGVYSTFVTRKTVCAGYSEGFAMLANALGVPALSVTSLMPDGSGHEWNEVCVNGKWYIEDATWNDTGAGRYTYFLKSEKYVFTDSLYSRMMHSLESFWSSAAVPDCTPKYQNTSTATKAMYRMYNPNSGEHFYTASSTERDRLMYSGWRYEGVGWNAPTSGTPVYRLYNPNAGDHHYTTSAGEKKNLVSLGWKYEGIGWYSGGSKKLLRLYNPNATAGAHHYTISVTEKNNLVNQGWRYEGVGWYGY